MYYKIKKIEFGLENCEVIEIAGEHIGNLNIDDIKNSIRKHHKTTIKSKSCKHFSISINRDANVDYDPFDSDDYRASKFDRLLKHKDIVSITIVYEDDSTDDFYVTWDGDSEYTNECEYTSKNDFGDLFIVIDKENKLEDIFKSEYINNKRNMDLKWKLNKIG